MNRIVMVVPTRALREKSVKNLTSTVGDVSPVPKRTGRDQHDKLSFVKRILRLRF